MTKVTGWDNGLSQDYDKGLGRWFANRLGARQQLRQDFEMTQLLIDRATLEQLVRMLEQCLDDAIQVQCDLEQGYSKSLALAQMVQVELSKEALTAGRAALANAEPRKVEKVKRREPTIDLGKYAGTYGGYITKDTP